MKEPTKIVPNKIQIIHHVEIYERGNVLSLDWPRCYSYPGAIFGISIPRAMEALRVGDASADINLPITF